MFCNFISSNETAKTIEVFHGLGKTSREYSSASTVKVFKTGSKSHNLN